MISSRFRSAVLDDAGAGISVQGNGMPVLNVRGVGDAARQTGRIGQQLHGRIAVLLRNGAIRLTPSSAAVKGMVKHALWEPPVLD